MIAVASPPMVDREQGERWTEYVDVDELAPAERNGKDHDDALIDSSLERFGYTSPIEVDERTGRMVVGHGRRERVLAAREAGKDAPEGVIVSDDGRWKVPVLRGWSSRSDADAEAYIVAHNRIGEAGGWRNAELTEQLLYLREHDALAGVGFNDHDLDDLLLLNAPPLDLDALGRNIGEPGERDFWPVLRLTVHPNTEGSWNELRMRLAIDDDDELVRYIVDACDAMKRRRKKEPTA